MKTISIILLTTLISGCLGPKIKQEGVTEKVVMHREANIHDQYKQYFSELSGRIEGLKESVVTGLSESLDVSRVSRELAEEALAVANEASSKLKEIQEELNVSDNINNLESTDSINENFEL